MIRRWYERLFAPRETKKTKPPSEVRALTFNPDTIVEDAIDEAIINLGLLKPSAKASMKALISRCMREGFRAVAISHRKDGEQLTKEEKKGLGIRANAFMSQQAASELTDKGKLKPLEAHFLTLWRADFTIHRAKYIVGASNYEFGRLTVLGGPHEGCALCQINSGKKIDPFSISPFPDPECPNEACGIHYLVDIDYKALNKSKR